MESVRNLLRRREISAKISSHPQRKENKNGATASRIFDPASAAAARAILEHGWLSGWWRRRRGGTLNSVHALSLRVNEP